LTFKEAVVLSEFGKVWEYLISEYNDNNKENSYLSYYKVYTNLVNMEPSESNLKIQISFHDERECERWDVSGYSEDDNTSYGIEFCPWSEWLAMELGEETLKELKVHEIVAHSLWELTWMGFEENEIQSRLDRIKVADDEIIEELSDNINNT